MDGSVRVRPDARFRAGRLALAGVAWLGLTVPAALLLGFGAAGKIAGPIAIWNSTAFATAFLLLPGGRRGTAPSAPRVPPVWGPDRSLRLALRGMAVGLIATSLYVVVGTLMARSRGLPDRIEIALLIFGGLASVTGICVARMAGMQVRADGSVLLVRGCFVAYRLPWRSIRRFEVRRGVLSEGLRVVLRDGTDRRIPVLDPGVAPSHIDATGGRRMAGELNAILASSAPTS